MEFDQNLTRYLNKQTTRVTQNPRIAEKMVGQVQIVYQEIPKGFIFPTQKAQIARLIEMLARQSLFQEQLQIVSPVCPDYSYHYSAIDQRRVYDFTQLNTGLGLSAEAVLEKTPTFLNLLDRVGIKNPHLRFLYADVEADDPKILESVGLAKDQFLERVDQSSAALAAVAQTLTAETSVGKMSSLLTEADYQRADRMITLVQNSSISSLAHRRVHIYDRWFRKRYDGLHAVEVDELRAELAKQDIVKALTFGSAARRQNLLVLDSTDPSFTSFYNFGDGLPPTPIVSVNNSKT